MLVKTILLGGLPKLWFQSPTWAIAPTLTQLSASAQLASYPPFKDAKGNVYLAPGSANAEVVITFRSVERQKEVKADACGTVHLTPSSSIPLSAALKVDGISVNPASLRSDIMSLSVASAVVSSQATVNNQLNKKAVEEP